MNFLRKQVVSVITLFVMVNLVMGILLVDTSWCSEEEIHSPRIFIVFRNDDLSAESEAKHETKVMSYFKNHHIPQTFGIIPNIIKKGIDPHSKSYHLLSENADIFALLQQWQKEGLIEIALHGYTHEDKLLADNVDKSKGFLRNVNFTEQNSEFCGLPFAEQFQRISHGKQLLEQWFNTPVTTFIFPWNTYDENTLRAGSKAGIRVVTSCAANLDYRFMPVEIKRLLFDRHTTGLDEKDKKSHLYVAKLDKFFSALRSARQFTHKHRKPVFINVLYHSWTIRSPEDFQLLETIVNEVSQSKDIVVMTLGNFTSNFSSVLENLYFIRQDAMSEIRKTVSFFSLISRESPVAINKEFMVLDSSFYHNAKQYAISLSRKFYLGVIFIGLLAGTIYLGLMRRWRLKKNIASYFMFGGAVFYAVIFFAGYFGLFSLDAGIGVIDEVLLLFFGIVLLAFVLGYFYSKKD